MMNETMQRIQKLSHERHTLWRTSGGLSSTQTRRVQDITGELAVLWDQYRRELAGDTRVRNRGTVREGSNAA